MRGFAIGLAVGLALGVMATWLLVPRVVAPVADERPTARPRDPAAGAAASGVPPERSVERRRAEASDEPRRAESSPTGSDGGWEPLPDTGKPDELAGLAEWPLERLLGLLRAEMRRTSFGPHAGAGACSVLGQLRLRFPEVELPAEMAREFAKRPAHYVNAAHQVRATWSAATLVAELARYEREGDPNEAAQVAALLGQRDAGALAERVERWLGSDDPRLVRIGLGSWSYASLSSDLLFGAY